ncbi:MAG TPA: ArsC/Spx/MgsR family protein [Candidatus Edwardsbacteria bacterium]|nr:ArsC/Spx/MgsR family protein [Candidatus Edwardsbacteria bacterium]
MAIQIFGTNKCQRTRAALRFFKERRVAFHFVDLAVKELSPGEFESVRRAVGLEAMIDRGGKEFARQGLQYQRFDIEAALKRNPGLLNTPIVREGQRATTGYQPEAWAAWITGIQ